MHTYMHACIHTYIYTCIHAYIHTYVHPSIHLYIHTKIVSCTRTANNTYKPTCIHTYTHIDSYVYTGCPGPAKKLSTDPTPHEGEMRERRKRRDQRTPHGQRAWKGTGVCVPLSQNFPKKSFPQAAKAVTLCRPALPFPLISAQTLSPHHTCLSFAHLEVGLSCP